MKTKFVAALIAAAFVAIPALSEDKKKSSEPEFAGTARPGPVSGDEIPVVSAGDQLIAAPDFLLTDLGGEKLRLSEIDAPVIILYFWTKYRQCEDDLALLQSLHEKYRDKGVVILGLAYNSGPTREEVRAFTEQYGAKFPMLMCTYNVKDAYDVATFPTTFALDRTKHIRYWMYGILVEEHWDTLIGEMLKAAEAN